MAIHSPRSFCGGCGAPIVDVTQSSCPRCGNTSSRLLPTTAQAATRAPEAAVVHVTRASAGPGMLAMASSFLGFALLEVVGSILIARFVLPGLIRAPGTQSLAQVRDQIAMAAYGVTAAAGALAATPSAYSARRHHHGFSTCIGVTLLGVVCALVGGVYLAVHARQAVVIDTIATHAIVATVAVVFTAAIFAVTPQRPNRPLRAVTIGAILIALLAPAFAPPPTFAAGGTSSAGDIDPDSCGFETINGSLDASLSLPLPSPPELISGSVEGEVAFDFSATHHPIDSDGNSWELAASGQLMAGPSLDLGVPDVLSVSLSSTAGVKATNHWSFASEADLVMAVTASMANFAWQNMAFVGLSSPPILGPTQDLIGESGLPAPSETDLGFLGEVKVDLKGDFMVGSLDGEIGGQGGVSLEIDHPTADVLDLLGQQKMTVRFSIGPQAKLDVAVGANVVLPQVPGSLGVGSVESGTIDTYITVERGPNGFQASQLGLEASGDLSGSAGPEAGIGDELIGASLKLHAGIGTSGEIRSQLNNLDKPEVMAALLTMLRYEIGTGQSWGISVAQLVGQPSRSELVTSAETLLSNGSLQALAYQSLSGDASVELRLIAKLSIDAKLSDSVLVSAWYSGGDLVVRPSQTCTAQPSAALPLP